MGSKRLTNLSWSVLTQRRRCERVLDTIVHMSAQRGGRGHGIALQCAVEQRPVLGGGFAAAIAERHHLVAEIEDMSLVYSTPTKP